MTPFQLVLSRYCFPSHIVPHPLQVEVINALAPLREAGYWLEMGTGKTFCSTAAALYRKIIEGSAVIVIMPPVLIRQWSHWLRSITPPLRITEYTGSPAVRATKNLDCDFLLVGPQVFVRDYERLHGYYRASEYAVIVDEASMLTNIETKTHKQIYDFCIGRPKMLLTGTPANSPLHAYALLKFTAPGTYYSFVSFQREHVRYVNTFGKAIEFQALDRLSENLLINSRRVRFEEMYSDSQEPLYAKLDYDLDSRHLLIYRRIAEHQLERISPSGNISALSIQRVLHALGQVVVSLDAYVNDSSIPVSALDLLDEKLAELGQAKLVVFAYYRRTVTRLMAHLGAKSAAALGGSVAPSLRSNALHRFIYEADCRVLVIQVNSGGYGIDGLQHVCNHCFFIEPCQQPRDFHQAVARLYRSGQRKRVVVYQAVAVSTLQERAFDALLVNDALVNQILRGGRNLRQVLLGARVSDAGQNGSAAA